MRGRILAVDDEANIRRLLTDELELEGFVVETAESGEQCLALLDREKFDLTLVDLKLPDMNGIDVIKEIKGTASRTEVVVITGHGNMEMAIQSMKLGARDFITKPFKFRDLIPVLDGIIQGKRSNEPEEVSSSLPLFNDGPAAKCPSQAMRNLYQQIRRIAASDATVLIQGETGVGKDVIARQIHAMSPRRKKPYVVVDCGLLSSNLAESELYGHRKGAFSGALDNRTGLVAAAEGGTLFLDEIGNIDLETQKKFLRFLETGKYRRVGDVSEVTVETRILLATNLPLADAVQKGVFRSDLLYRVNVFTLLIPPLRERREDIPVLAEHFLKADSQSSDPARRISSQAMDILTQYPWPGNVRELRSVILKSKILASSSIIEPQDLPCLISSRKPGEEQPMKTLAQVEKIHIKNILDEVGGNRTKAAKILGIHRRSLYSKILKYDIFA